MTPNKFLKIVFFISAIIFISSCKRTPVFEGSSDPGFETVSVSVKGSSDLIANIRSDIYNSTWFEEHLQSFDNNLTGSMISVSLVPLLSAEKDLIRSIISGMSVNEKLGQLFVLDLKDNDKDLYLTEMNDRLIDLLKDFKPGGFILYGDNIRSNLQIDSFIKKLQSFSALPLFVAVDQEGGRVSRLNSSSEMQASKAPPHQVLGDLGEPDAAWQVGRLIGIELNSLGFNMNFAPVADINSNPDNPVLGNRSFSENSEIASLMVKSFVQGLQESGVCSVVKHFPGHGDTSADSHSGEVSVGITLEKLRSREFLPFQAGIAQGAAGVMTAHIITPLIEETNGLPATMSTFLVRDILRKELGFKGMIISDSFTMGAIRNYWSPGESAAAFIAAGGDIILRPADAGAALEGLLKLYNEGILTEKRIDESVVRILSAKLRFGLFTDQSQFTLPDFEEHQLIIDEILSQ